MRIRTTKATITILAACALNLAGVVCASPTVGPVYDVHPSELVGMKIDLAADKSQRADSGLILTWRSQSQELQKPGPMWELNEPEFEILHRLRRIASEQEREFPGGSVEAALAP